MTEGKGKEFRYATASCQGWRREQEDAEECIPYYDDDASLFVLCDGHGGAEVAKYTVEHFPTFLKNHPLYKEGKYEEALRKAFIDFDALLRTDKVIAELNKIAFDDEQNKNQIDEDEDDEQNSDKDNKSKTNENEMDIKEEEQGTSSSSASNNNSNNASAASSASEGPSSAGPSSSTNNGPSSVVEDVDTETLRREAQVPLDVLIDKYSGQPPLDSRARSIRQTSLNLAGSPVIRPSKSANDEDDDSDTDVKKEGVEQPSSSKKTEEGESSSSSKAENSSSSNPIYQLIFKKAMEQYFDDKDNDDDSEDDSEFDGNEESDTEDDDDEDDDEDGDDECDEDNTAETPSKSKKLRHKRNKVNDESESSSEDDTEDDDDDDDDDENGKDDDEDDDEEAEDEGEDEEEEVEEEEEEDELDGRFSCLRKINQNLKAASRLHKPGIDSGCTVVVALVKGNQLYVASAGDSRCIVIMRNGQCIPMSFDHKPEDATEHNRIRKAGGRVTDGRVNGGLNLSRAFGDFSYKDHLLEAELQMITPVPDVKTFLVDPYKVEYILLACDGIWNSMNNNRVAKFIRKTAPGVENDLVKLCLALFRNCIAPKTDGDGTGCDNMTCILVKYDDLEDGKKETTATEATTTNLEDLKNSSDQIDGSKTMTSKNNDSQETTVSNKRSADDSTLTTTATCKRRCLRL